MSLDVYLVVPGSATGEPRERIFVREGGRNVEVTREEYEARFPGREPTVVLDDGEGDYVYEANITHNLNRMAEAANLYGPLWRPDEHDLALARDLIVPLQDGLAALRATPDRFRELNPPNGWGDYDLLVSFVERYLAACEDHPLAEVQVSR